MSQVSDYLTHSHFWHYLCRDSVTPQVKGSVLQDHPLTTLPTSDASCKPGLSPVLLTNWLQMGESNDPSLGLSNLLVAHRTQRNSVLTRLLVYYLMIQLNNRQMKVMHRASMGKGCRPSMPSGGGAFPHIFINQEALLILWGFLWKLHYIGKID